MGFRVGSEDDIPDDIGVVDCPYWAYYWLMDSLVRTEALFGCAAALVVVLV